MSVVVFNHDLAALCRQNYRITQELFKSVSSGTSGINQFDQERLTANVKAVRSLLAWVVAQPQLDLPESHPTAIELPDPIKYEPVESDSCNLVLDMCFACQVELVNCVSGRDAAGMNQFDALRLNAVLDKIDKLVTDHVATATPLDLPESTPSEPLAGPGALGQTIP